MHAARVAGLGHVSGRSLILPLTCGRHCGPLQALVRKGQLRSIGVLSERRHGRNVTAVSRVESFGLSAEELAGLFQRKFQTSCR